VASPSRIEMSRNAVRVDAAGNRALPFDDTAAPHSPLVVVRDLVRWSDVDAAGIVYFGRYLRFFELAETELFARAKLPAPLLRDEHGIWLVRRRVECDFLRPLRLDTTVETSARVVRIGRSSLDLRFEVTVGESSYPYAEGFYACVAVDRETLATVSLPQPVRNALQEFVDPAASPSGSTVPACR
jgi:acyl-CoA thioester hydrolase